MLDQFKSWMMLLLGGCDAIRILVLGRFDAIGGTLQRKLGALGLTALLGLPVPALVARLELIAAHVTAVWFEVCQAGTLTWGESVNNPRIIQAMQRHGLPT